MLYKICIFFIFSVCVHSVQAQTCTTNTNNGSWTSSGIWSCGNVPNAGNDVAVANTGITFTTSAGANVTIKSLTINSNKDLTINGNFRLTVTNNLTLENQASLFISGGATIDVKGALHSANNGNVSVDGSGSGGSFLTRGCYTVGGGGSPISNIFGGSNLNWCVQCGNDNSGNGCNQLLPVRWLLFRGVFQNNTAEPTVKLEWAMVGSADFDRIEIEKSANNQDFEKIGQIQKQSRFASTQYYQFIDQTPFLTQTYYRLKEIEQGGSSSYSRTIVVNNPLDNWLIWKYLQGNWTVQSQKNIEQITVQNTIGKMVFSANYTDPTYEMRLDQKFFPAGVYVVMIKTSQSIFFKKIQF